MSDCCSSNNSLQQACKHRICPENNKQYGQVPFKTVLQHIKAPWKHALQEQTYYFCNDPDCDIVYFTVDETYFRKDQLRTKVGIKETSDDALLCYCFGVSKFEARTDVQTKKFVIQQTKNSMCSCITHNPSGKCCLKDFPK